MVESPDSNLELNIIVVFQFHVVEEVFMFVLFSGKWPICILMFKYVTTGDKEILLVTVLKH